MTIEEWAKDFKSFVNELQMPRDDYNGIMAYIDDAIALLKKQEPVKPDSFMDGRVQRFACKKCGKHLLYAEWGRDNYCPKCGQAVKWG